MGQEELAAMFVGSCPVVGGWAKGGFSHASTGLLSYTSHIQLILGLLCPLYTWSFDFFLIITLHFQLKTLVSWNVKGLNHPVLRSIFTHLKRAAFGLFCKTHIPGTDSTCLMSRWAGQHFHSSFHAKARGFQPLWTRISPCITMVYQILMAVLSSSQGKYTIQCWCLPMFMLQM